MTDSLRINSLPQGSSEVIATMTQFEEFTFSEILQNVSLEEKPLRYIMRCLINAKIILAIPDLLDMRSKSYKLHYGLIGSDEFVKHNEHLLNVFQPVLSVNS